MSFTIDRTASDPRDEARTTLAHDVLRAMLGAPPKHGRPRRLTTGAPAWRFLPDGRVRVVVLTWGHRDVASKWSGTYATPRDAWQGWRRAWERWDVTYRAFLMLGYAGNTRRG